MLAQPRPSSAAAPQLLAALSLAAAIIHASVIPEHMREYVPYGWFFVAVTVFQGVWAIVVLVHPRVGWLGLGIAVNLAVIAVWAWSRMAGLPIGPKPGVPEAAGVSDISCCVYELLLVGIAVAIWSFEDLAVRRGGQAVAIAVLLVAMSTAIVLGRSVATSHAGGTTHHMPMAEAVGLHA